MKHHSKEFLIASGLYQKPLGKRTYKKLKKCGGLRLPALPGAPQGPGPGLEPGEGEHADFVSTDASEGLERPPLAREDVSQLRR